ncbi:MAG TPA: hypothetical protein VIF09_03795 [Polyangiaceae bacterium]
MSSRTYGFYLVLASAAFWASWALMPGVGVTDTAVIFALVGQHRAAVFTSVAVQLASSAAYAPGVAGILATGERPSPIVRTGGALLLMGAMGSAADAVFHLVAYEMTAPGIAAAAVAPVMQQLQGADLAMLLPFVVAFFLGHVLVVTELRRRGRFARAGFRVLLASPLVLVAGGSIARFGLVPGRVVGLALLGALSGSLALVGASMMAGEHD